MTKSTLTLLCWMVASQVVFGQQATLTAEPASMVVETWKKQQTVQLEVRIKGSFLLENKSRQTILVPRGAPVVDGVRVAESAIAAREGRFVFLIEPDFFSAGESAPTLPQLNQFVALGSGESHLFTIERTLVGTADPSESNRYALHPGRTYWIQFRFGTLPEYFYSKDDKVFNKFRRKRKRTGLLLNQEVWTEPASFHLVLDGDRPTQSSPPGQQ